MLSDTLWFELFSRLANHSFPDFDTIIEVRKVMFNMFDIGPTKGLIEY